MSALGAVSLIREDGRVRVDALEARLRLTSEHLAQSVGLRREAISKKDRVDSPKTQSRLRDLVIILSRVERWAGSLPQAYAWYRAQPLPSFGDRTAESLVREGRAADVLAYLDRIAEGGYA